MAWHFFLLIYLFMYFLFCLTCQKVNQDFRPHLSPTSAEMFFYLSIILKENYFLKLGLDKLKVRTDQTFQAQA